MKRLKEMTLEELHAEKELALALCERADIKSRAAYLRWQQVLDEIGRRTKRDPKAGGNP